jgi:hypothetical protein
MFVAKGCVDDIDGSPELAAQALKATSTTKCDGPGVQLVI